LAARALIDKIANAHVLPSSSSSPRRTEEMNTRMIVASGAILRMINAAADTYAGWAAAA
jgi:hypothetical protein